MQQTTNINVEALLRFISLYDVVDLPWPAIRSLSEQNICTLWDVIQYSATELLKKKGITALRLEKIIKELSYFGLELKRSC